MLGRIPFTMHNSTSDEKEIRLWALRHNAHPVERAPFIHDGEPASLGLVLGDLPIAQESLRPIAWSQFFAMFHVMGLVLVYDFDNENEFELLKVDGEPSGPYSGKLMQA